MIFIFLYCISGLYIFIFFLQCILCGEAKSTRAKKMTEEAESTWKSKRKNNINI